MVKSVACYLLAKMWPNVRWPEMILFLRGEGGGGVLFENKNAMELYLTINFRYCPLKILQTQKLNNPPQFLKA